MSSLTLQKDSRAGQWGNTELL